MSPEAVVTQIIALREQAGAMVAQCDALLTDLAGITVVERSALDDQLTTRKAPRVYGGAPKEENDGEAE